MHLVVGFGGSIGLGRRSVENDILRRLVELAELILDTPNLPLSFLYPLPAFIECCFCLPEALNRNSVSTELLFLVAISHLAKPGQGIFVVIPTPIEEDLIILESCIQEAELFVLTSQLVRQ